MNHDIIKGVVIGALVVWCLFLTSEMTHYQQLAKDNEVNRSAFNSITTTLNAMTGALVDTRGQVSRMTSDMSDMQAKIGDLRNLTIQERQQLDGIRSELAYIRNIPQSTGYTTGYPIYER